MKAPKPATMASPGQRHARVASTAGVPLSASQTSVAAASSLRPVRSTLVAPILPEPMARMSSTPASRVDDEAERDRAGEIAETERR